MPRLLGAMRERGDDVELEPQPGLENVEPLAESVRLAGLPVRVLVEGTRAAAAGDRPFGLSHSPRGVVNALKHADAEHADVVIGYRGNLLQLEVRDDGRGPVDGGNPGPGLVGIRERAKLYGGEVTAGAANGAGFVLTASLRLTDDAR